MQEIGTLAELDVKPGDVVELVSGPVALLELIGHRYEIGTGDAGLAAYKHDVKDISHIPMNSWWTFRIVSRATPAEPASTSEIVWGEWGGVGGIEDKCGDFQIQRVNGVFRYRYPVPKKPVVETVTMYGHHLIDDKWVFGVKDSEDTARITFETRDGKPDWSTLRGEDIS